MRHSRLLALIVAILLGCGACRPGSGDGENAASGDKTKLKEKKSLDISFIPEDCFLAIIVHPKRIVDSPLAEGLSHEVTEWWFNLMTGWGVSPRKVEERVMIVAPREPVAESDTRPWRDQGPWNIGAIVRFAEPIADMELVGKMFADYEFAAEQTNHEGIAYYKGYWSHVAWTKDRKRPVDLAVCLPDDRTVVFSWSESLLKKMLSANEVKGDLVGRLRKLDPENDLILAATTRGARAAVDSLAKELEQGMPQEVSGLLAAPNLGSTATLTMDLRVDPVATLVVDVNGAGSGAKLKGLVEDALTMGKSLFRAACDEKIRNAPTGADKETEWFEWSVEMVEESFNGISVSQDGAKLTASLRKPRALAKLPKLATTLFETQQEEQDRLERRIKTEGQVGMVVVYEVDTEKTPAANLSALELKTLLATIERRLNPGGRRSGLIRQLDDRRLEVDIFRADTGVMQRIADLLPRPGTLEFRILANEHDHRMLIKRAKAQPDSKCLLDDDGNLLASWVAVEEGKEESFNADKDTATRTTRQDNHDILEVLVVKDKFDVTGNYVKRAEPSVNHMLEFCVSITFNATGSQLFDGLTGSNLPDQAQGFRRRLGVILDGHLHSAPAILSRVSERCFISGNFTEEQAQDLADLLNAGVLPVTIRKVEQRVVDIERQPSP